MKFIVAASIMASAAAFAPIGELNSARADTKLNLWGEPNKKEGEGGNMSEALPFVPRPKLLDGTLAGDRGFE